MKPLHNVKLPDLTTDSYKTLLPTQVDDFCFKMTKAVKTEDCSSKPGGLFAHVIPGMDQLHIPVNMSKELRLEVARNLKALQKELAAGGAPDRSGIYEDLGDLTQAQKDLRKKGQNRKAGQRNRLKKLQMIWELVSGIQDLHQQARQKDERLRKLQEENTILRLGPDAGASTESVNEMIQKLQAENEDLRTMTAFGNLPKLEEDSLELPKITSLEKFRMAAHGFPVMKSNANEFYVSPPSSLPGFTKPKQKVGSGRVRIGVGSLVDSLEEIIQSNKMMSMDRSLRSTGSIPGIPEDPQKWAQDMLNQQLDIGKFDVKKEQPLSESQRQYLQQFDQPSLPDVLMNYSINKKIKKAGKSKGRKKAN